MLGASAGDHEAMPCRGPAGGTCHGHSRGQRRPPPAAAAAGRGGRGGGIALISGISWVMSLRLPPVSDTASGIPCPSVITWCFEPGLARPTGLGPVSGRPSPPARASCQSPPWTSPAPRPRSARPAAAHEAAATPRPHASPAAAASTSSPSRTPAPAARTPTGYRYTGRTRSRTGPCGHPAACVQDDQPAAGTTGSSGSIRAHNPSGTIHGGCSPFLTGTLNRRMITDIPRSFC